MKRLFFLFLFSTAGYAESWQQVGVLQLNAGYWDLFPYPMALDATRQSNKLKVEYPKSCNVSLTAISFLENGAAVTRALENETSTPTNTSLTYAFLEPHYIDHVALRISLDGTCLVTFYQLAVVRPPPGKAVRRQCEKVAFLLHYDYEDLFEQISVLDFEDTCLVFIRFRSLQSYRSFLEQREDQNLSPDFDILQPENVKVDMEHRL